MLILIIVTCVLVVALTALVLSLRIPPVAAIEPVILPAQVPTAPSHGGAVMTGDRHDAD